MKPGGLLIVVLSAFIVFLLFSGLSADRPAVSAAGPMPSQMAEGRSYDITWTSTGIHSVTIEAEGDLISLPGNPRGKINIVIAQKVPAELGKVKWTVPFLDTVRFTINITGYDEEGRFVAVDSRKYLFRPEVLRTRTANGIYVDLRNLERQRLYRLHNNVVTHAYLTSGSRSGVFLPKTADSAQPHDHVGVFRVTYKNPMYWSNEYKVWMTHAMRFWKGHFIHGTYPSEYPLLGRPASSGCIRLDRTNAKELYDITPIGTRVEIFGNL